MSDILYQYNQDDIQFNGVKEPGIAVQNAIITTNNNYEPDERQPNVISGKKNNIINAIDIDWNSADIKLINKSASINTSGQMLKLYRDGINTSYDLANTAKLRADSAYNLALEAQTGGMSEDDIKDYIDSQMPTNIVSYIAANKETEWKTGWIDLISYTNDNYVPVNIFNLGNDGFAFGVNKENIANSINLSNIVSNIELPSGLQLTGSIQIGTDREVTSYLPIEIYRKPNTNGIYFNINKSDIPSANYTAGDSYININNNKISLNENAILSYLKTTELNKNYYAGNGINIDSYNYISTNIVAMEGIAINNTGNTINISIKKPDENSYLKYVGQDNKLVVDIDAVKAYIGNSGQGQTITVDSELSSTSTNPVQNKVINNKLSEFVKVGGDTTGTLAVINGTQVNASTATTDGNDIYVSSDRRLKDNILDITEGEVERLFESESGNMHYFEWKENHKPSFGFIAQELIGFAPEAVTSDSEYMQVNYNAALTKTCAALFKKIKQLEKRIKILEGES